MTCEEVDRLTRTDVETATLAEVAAVIAHVAQCHSCELRIRERANGLCPPEQKRKGDRVYRRLMRDPEALEMIYGKQPPQ